MFRSLRTDVSARSEIKSKNIEIYCAKTISYNYTEEFILEQKSSSKGIQPALQSLSGIRILMFRLLFIHI